MAPRRLGDVLVENGALTPGELQRYLAIQAADPPKHRRRLGRILLEDERVSEITLAMALAECNDLEFVDLSLEKIDGELARSIPKLIAQRGLVLPLATDGKKLRVAAADPIDVVSLDDVRMSLRNAGRGMQLEVVVAPESQIRRRLASVWSEATTVAALKSVKPDFSTERIDVGEVGDEGAVSAVHQILASSIRLGASDIHIEPMADAVRVRMRVDGTLRKTMVLPKAGQAMLVSRIKIMANLDIAQKRVPQDGRAHIVFDGMVRNIRVSTLPTLHGEKVVIRLLTDIGELPALPALGLPSRELELVHRALRSSQGLVLITGPTGSGKTTTLYSAVHEVVTGDRNLITLEEPVEIELPGVTQVQIDEKSGMTYAAGLRAVLRQDPDIIMVGEVRDQATADLTIRAALTGHLVLATVHTTDAPSAAIRLVDIGVPRFLVASSLKLVIAQRLVRKPCRSCQAPQIPDSETAQRLGLTAEEARSLVLGVGCAACEGQGYKGRTGIFEVMPVDHNMRKALGEGADADGLAAAARAGGWRSLREAGVAAAVNHQTTVEELLRTLTSVSDW